MQISEKLVTRNETFFTRNIGRKQFRRYGNCNDQECRRYVAKGNQYGTKVVSQFAKMIFDTFTGIALWWRYILIPKLCASQKLAPAVCQNRVEQPHEYLWSMQSPEIDEND